MCSTMESNRVELNRIERYSCFFMFPSHPFERLLSAYNDKFIRDQGEYTKVYIKPYVSYILKHYRNISDEDLQKPESFNVSLFVCLSVCLFVLVFVCVCVCVFKRVCLSINKIPAEIMHLFERSLH